MYTHGPLARSRPKAPRLKIPDSRDLVRGQMSKTRLEFLPLNLGDMYISVA